MIKCKIDDVAQITITLAKFSDINELFLLYKPEKGVNDFSGLHTKKRFRSLIKSKDDILLVARRKGKIVGALDAEFYDESRFSYFANIVVAKEERRKGIAQLLMDEYERVCRKRKISMIIGLVYDWNKCMHGFMKKRKYKLYGTLAEYLKKL